MTDLKRNLDRYDELLSPQLSKELEGLESDVEEIADIIKDNGIDLNNNTRDIIDNLKNTYITKELTFRKLAPARYTKDYHNWGVSNRLWGIDLRTKNVYVGSGHESTVMIYKDYYTKIDGNYRNSSFARFTDDSGSLYIAKNTDIYFGLNRVISDDRSKSFGTRPNGQCVTVEGKYYVYSAKKGWDEGLNIYAYDDSTDTFTELITDETVKKMLQANNMSAGAYTVFNNLCYSEKNKCLYFLLYDNGFIKKGNTLLVCFSLKTKSVSYNTVDLGQLDTGRTRGLVCFDFKKKSKIFVHRVNLNSYIIDISTITFKDISNEELEECLSIKVYGKNIYALSNNTICQLYNMQNLIEEV